MTRAPGFSWPPAAPVEPPPPLRVAPAPAPPRPDSARRPVLRLLLDAVERDWLGLVSGPFDTRAREASWRPDAPTDYCPRCGGTWRAARPITAGPGCGACFGVDLAWQRAVRLGEYAGVLRDSVLELKFRGRRATGRALGRLLGTALAESLRVDEPDALGAGRVVIAPVSPNVLSRLARGVDHTLTLARAAAGEVGAPVARLLRRRFGPSQRAVPMSRRAANVARAFRGRPAALGPGTVIVVVDDVKTTGATMSAACRAVRRGVGPGPAIWAAWAAVTPGPREG